MPVNQIPKQLHSSPRNFSLWEQAKRGKSYYRWKIDGLHEVELFIPFLNDTSAKACGQKDVVGLLVLSGSMCSFAYLTPKEPISQAAIEIKSDIIRSLQSRLDIICDEADEDLAPTDNGGEEASNEKPVSKLILHLLRFSKNFCVELMSMEALTDFSSIFGSRRRSTLSNQ